MIKALYTNPQHLVHVAEQLETRDFSYRPFRILYVTIKKLAASNTVVNGESVMALLQTESQQHYKEMLAIGGAEAIDTLYDQQYKTLVSLDEHIHAIRDRADNQRLVNAANKLKEQIESGTPNETALATFDKEIQAVKLKGRQQDVRPVGHDIDGLLTRIIEQDQEIVGISIANRYPKLDRMIKHIQPRRVTIFLANYKSGKSTLLMDLGWTLASDHGIGVLYGDTELFDSEVQLRLLSKVSGFPMDYILTGYWNNSDEHRNIILAAKEKIKNTPFYWHNVNHLSRSQIVSLVKLSQLKYGIQAFVYDYIKPDVEDAEGRVDLQIGAKVDMLKESIAKSCDIAVLSAIQMNEETGRAANGKEPERLADNVIVLRRATDDDGDPMATHMLWMKTSRYTEMGIKIPIEIDFSKQSIREV